MRLSTRVVGLEEAKKQLRDLPKAVRNRAMRAGFRRIGQTTAKALKSIVPGRGKTGRFARSGQLKKSIGFRIKLYRTSGRIVVAIGPRSGFSTEVQRTPGAKPKTHNPTRIFHFMDRGKKNISPRWYLQRAASMVKAQYRGIMQQEVNKAVAAWQLKQSQS